MIIKRAGFTWGVSTAAYQTEGAWNQDGKGPSTWDDFTHRNRRRLRGQSGDVACDFYHRYEEDLDLMQAMGIPAFRWSVAWSRVLPEGVGRVNEKGLDFYDRLTDACLTRGIEPWVTLYHWDLPLALERRGGWTNRDILSWFEDYTALMARRLGDRVRDWMVLNEPMVFTGAGYFLGIHAPGRRGFGNFIPAMLHAALAMGAGGRVLRAELSKGARIGTTFSGSYVAPLTQSPKDLSAARRADAILNRLYIEPVLGMGFPLEELPVLKSIEKYMKLGDASLLPFDFDFLGLQVYTREVVRYSFWTPYLKAKLVHPKKRGLYHTQMGWEVYPESMYHLLKRWQAYPNMPRIVVTENGAAFPDRLIDGQIQDSERQAYLETHIREMLRARAEGVPVDGYFVWTLTDNFEWAEGYRPRFGLVHMDFETQRRTVKASGRWYGEFIQDLRTLEPAR